MKTKAIIAAAIMVAASFMILVPMLENDAAVNSISIEGGNTITVDRATGGVIVLNYNSTGNSSCTVSLYDAAYSTPIYSELVYFSSGDGSISIPLVYDKKDQSQVQMKITFKNGSTEVYKDIYFTLKYTTSIWSNWAVYGIIAAVVILIIALVIFKSRSAPKKDKNTLTFEQIEAEKQAQKSAPKETPRSEVKSERQRYLASKKK